MTTVSGAIETMSIPSVQRSGRLPARSLGLAIAILLSLSLSSRADSPWLYGIHWWGYKQGEPVDNNPAVMLDCPAYGGWDLETILTHDATWWAAAYFTPLYQNLYQSRNVTIITRIDYKWGETVPSPTNPDYAGWPAAVVNTVNTLAGYAHIWLIGNEPNIVGEGNNWPSNQVTPSGYATIYRNVRNAIHNQANNSPAGQHIVLVAAPSPGGVIPGVRWMDGSQWLSQVLDNIPGNEVDGIALHSYGGSVNDFHNTFVSLLSVIDSHGLQDRPVYITEWNKVTNEADMAQFVRDCFADLNAWNQTPGHHNIRCLCWFVYDADTGWDDHAIEYYRTTGYPLGDPRDLYTAFQQTVDLRYPAGIVGTLPTPPELDVTPVSFARVAYFHTPLAADQFTVSNSGGGTLNYTITDNATWLSVDPPSGTSTGEADPISVIYDNSELPVGGPYNATITVSDPNANNSPRLVSVSVTVQEWPHSYADFDRDTDVDADDFSHLQACMTGAELGPPDPGCEDADLDLDGDVDLGDFGRFQRCLSGSGHLADSSCED
jgi:hypothetical protein